MICWDLDETLGYFRPLADELVARYRAAQRGPLERLGHRLGLLREPAPEGPGPPPVRAREGIGEVLAELQAAGFRQVLTTASFHEYAELALERVELRGYFDAVYGRETVWNGHGKVYAEVLAAHGQSAREVVIVGDDFRRDHAQDHPEVVLVCQPDGLEQPAAPLLPVLRALLEGGDVQAAFERLYARARFEGLARVVEVGEQRVSLDYWGDYRRGLKVPVLSDLRPA